MKKKILALCIVSAMCLSLTTGCGNKTATTDTTATSNQTETTQTEEKTTEETKTQDKSSTEKSAKSDKISVKNLSETSTPIGVSELAVKVDGDIYVSGKISNNESEYEETIITLELEVVDSNGKKIHSGKVTTNRGLSVGETYSFDKELYYWDKIEEGETLTVKVVDITIEDAALAELAEEFESDVYELDNLLGAGKYNSAAILWDEIKETYGDAFKDEIKAMEAAIKDEGLDPDNIANGTNDSTSAEEEITTSDTTVTE